MLHYTLQEWRVSVWEACMFGKRDVSVCVDVLQDEFPLLLYLLSFIHMLLPFTLLVCFILVFKLKRVGRLETWSWKSNDYFYTFLYFCILSSVEWLLFYHHSITSFPFFPCLGRSGWCTKASIFPSPFWCLYSIYRLLYYMYPHSISSFPFFPA